jgi:tripartite-type tricarboxylate transporter receptor subunit TctC
MNLRNRTNTMRRYMCLLPALLPVFVHAQPTNDDYPTKSIRMIIGFPAGGPTDAVGRTIAQKLSQRLGQQVVVENIAGAGANLGAQAAARSAPDGYTMHYNTSTIAIAPSIYPKLSYHPVKDFAPVVLTAEVPLVLVVNSSVKAETPKDLIALIQKQPGRINYGSSGNGTIEHLALAQFVSAYKLDAAHVPYKGVAPALLDLMAGQTQFAMTSLNTALPYIKDGRLKALAVGSKARSKALPAIPTMSESLRADFVYTAWQGIVFPKGTPQEIVDKVNRTVNDVLKDDALRQQLSAQGVEVIGGSPDQYATFIKSELERWWEAVKVSGARVQ